MSCSSVVRCAVLSRLSRPVLSCLYPILSYHVFTRSCHIMLSVLSCFYLILSYRAFLGLSYHVFTRSCLIMLSVLSCLYPILSYRAFLGLSYQMSLPYPALSCRSTCAARGVLGFNCLGSPPTSQQRRLCGLVEPFSLFFAVVFSRNIGERRELGVLVVP